GLFEPFFGFLWIAIINRKAQLVNQAPDLANDRYASSHRRDTHVEGEVPRQPLLPCLMVGIIAEDLLEQPGDLVVVAFQEGIDPTPELVAPGDGNRFPLRSISSTIDELKFILVDRIGEVHQAAFLSEEPFSRMLAFFPSSDLIIAYPLPHGDVGVA